MAKSAKIVSLVDLCGHEKYLKTTINGLTGLSPYYFILFSDFGCVVVGANMGLQKMTREHIGLCLFLKIPFFMILTKVDLAPQNKYEETLTEIKKILKNKLLNKFPILITDKTSKTVKHSLFRNSTRPLRRCQQALSAPFSQFLVSPKTASTYSLSLSQNFMSQLLLCNPSKRNNSNSKSMKTLWLKVLGWCYQVLCAAVWPN